MRILQGAPHFTKGFIMYDTIRFYCPYCQEKNHLRIEHENASNDFFQSINIPSHIAVEIKSQTIQCENCNKNISIDLEDIPIRQYNLKVRKDCTGQYRGMEEWYEPQHRWSRGFK